MDFQKYLHTLPEAQEGLGGLPGDYYAKVTYLSGIDASPEHKELAWVETKLDLEKNKNVQDIFVYDAEHGRRQMTSSGDVGGFTWLDDDTLLFQSASRKDQPASETKEETQIWYRLSLHGGEAQPFLKLQKQAMQLEPLGDDRFVMTVSEDVNWKPDASLELQKKTNEARAAYRNLNRLPFYLNGAGWQDRQITRLYLYDKAEDEFTLLSDLDQDLGQMELSEDKKRVLFTASKAKTKMTFTEGLYELDLATKEVKTLLEEGTWSLGNAFYWDGDVAVLASDMQELGINQNTKLALVQDGKLNFITDELCAGNALGSDLRQGGNRQAMVHGDYFYLIQTRSNRVVLEAFNKAGDAFPVIEDIVSVEGFDFLGDDLYALCFVGETLTNLYRLPVGVVEDRLAAEPRTTAIDALCELPLDDPSLELVYEANPSPGATKPIRITYESAGIPMEGWVLLPENYSDDGALPGFYDVHGGPKTIYGPVLYHEMQYWVSQGYVVFFTNPRGSAGRGDAFSDIRGKYGSIDYDDLMTFLDVVLERYPGIDPEKIGMTGGSYGGFMANWMLTHTDRFKAIATQRSITNWTSFYGVSDIGYYFATDQNGTSIDEPDFWSTLWDHSPIKYIDDAKTPTLIIHSAHDYRCPLEQGYQLYNALLDRGVPASLVLFHEENHNLSRTGKPQARYERLAAITQWMAHYVKGETLETVNDVNDRLYKEAKS